VNDGLVSRKHGVIFSLVVERILFFINKDTEKKRAQNRALRYTSDNVIPLAVVKS